MKKRILSLILALMMIISVVPALVYAGEVTAAEDKVVVEEKQPAPTELTLSHNATNIIDGVIVTAKGDKFKLSAFDENGEETPVTWSKDSWNNSVSLDEQTGEVEVTGDIYSSTSYWYFTATSTLDETIKKEITVLATGYKLSEYQKAQTVALSPDGQTAKTASLNAGKKGYNIWSYNIADGVAEVVKDPENGGEIKFNVFRPGVIEISYKLTINEELSDTATITITGVAVEDSDGKREKTYLGITSENPNPEVKLLAFVQEGREVSSWNSSDKNVATVDENGIVTAKSVGSTIITATDSEGVTGGIKVVCESEETPYFENLQFLSSAISDYNNTYVFSPTKTDYNLNIRSYSTTKLTLQKTTLFDDEKYDAIAEYTDINGDKQSVAVLSGGITYLEGIPFDESHITITLYDKNNEDNKTVYSFDVVRPRDTTKTIKSGGIVLVPDGRALLTTKYNGYAEGTMLKLNEDGSFKTGWGTNLDTGVSGTHYSYKCFLLGDESFSLKITGSTVYEHIRISTDGESWTELSNGGSQTGKVEFSEDKKSAEIKIQIIDDKTYTDNVKVGNDGFADCQPNEYTLVVEKANTSFKKAQILTATTDSGDWYPNEFDEDTYTYSIVVPSDVTEKTLTYTVSEGATVKVGNTVQEAVDGVYTITLTTSQKTLNIISDDGKITNSYNFKIQKKISGVPDKVVDYLCINSQYTNGANGTAPWSSLSQSVVSLGNFGGYITYYYEDALKDNPNNMYGIDFYVYGNANKDTTTSTKTSFFEPAQAWVSEDGINWYALAGSAHYEDGVDWNYSITYKKASNGKTAWEDSYANANSGETSSGVYPSSSIYNMNNLANEEEIKLSGIVLPARNGEVAVWGEAVDSYPVKWGYADCFANGTKGKDVNPYEDNTNFDLQANGFDLKWAVDENGNPVDVSVKEFHYVKLVTASNIWHSSFGDKSPEISGMLKTVPQNESVGTTKAPIGVTITDGAETKVINFNENEQIYNVDIGDMKYVSISVNGAEEDDNIYINNTRITYNENADGFKVTKECGEKLIRIVVQNGECEPVIYLLKLTGMATESNDFIEGIKLDVSGISRTATTKDGKTYKTSVGHRISSVSLYPVADGSVNVTVNGDALKDEYELVTGKNIFTITGEKDGIIHTVTLEITKDSNVTSSGKITVYFTLLGDEAHGESDEVHTLKNGGLDTWIKKTPIEVDASATVLDVFEKALGLEYTFTNADGNYISEINGLKEFTNGSLSGWMYTINGSRSAKGVAEQTVKNGDKIIFHYTDDYTVESSSEKFNSGSSGANTVAVYTVKFETNGAGEIKNQVVKKNEVVTKPDIPQKDGYVFAGWYKDEEFKNEYNFDSKVTDEFTLYAKWIHNSESIFNFTDVKAGAWYEDAVNYVVINGLFNGISQTEFVPDENMTRAMLVTVLYRLEKAEETDKTSKFKDVLSGAWYEDAVIWAEENGVVTGVSDTEFAPNESITREQMATIIYRYAKLKGYRADEYADLSGYSDTNQIGTWAVDALRWAVNEGVINGISAELLSPKATATRAHVAMLLMRFCENK